MAFIEDIYRQCDTWCQRCAFTAQCQHFATLSPPDPIRAWSCEPKVFWERLDTFLAPTLEALNHYIQDEGVNLSEKPDGKFFHPYAAFHPSQIPVVWAQIYGEKVELWKLLPKTSSRTTKVLLPTEELWEVIEHYQHFFYVKCNRIRTYVEGTRLNTSVEELNYEIDKEVRVALEALDRSLAAWGGLSDCYENDLEGILSILIILLKLRYQLIENFPEAESFTRVGFDE